MKTGIQFKKCLNCDYKSHYPFDSIKHGTKYECPMCGSTKFEDIRGLKSGN